MTKFEEMGLAVPILKSLNEIGYTTPTAIQNQTIPLILSGHDLLGIAQTGTGKTAAFCLPLINHIFLNKPQRNPKKPNALILAPTRELAIQIHENLKTYGRYLRQKYVVIFGGVGQANQVSELRDGCDVLIATPGRLLDLVGQKLLNLSHVKFFVLDEADRMLDMGFLNDVKRAISFIPEKRHTLFFSATMPNEIQKLSDSILNSPQKIQVTPPSTTVKKISQSIMFVEKNDKLKLLIHLLTKIKGTTKNPKVLVFVQMKHMANRVTETLLKNGISAAAIHGNKSQGARQRAIQDFSSHRIQTLIATDIASRGIDIEGITHVINFELSHIVENYVHRIGRTARAGAIGEAISLVTGEEKSYVSSIETVTQQKIEVFMDHPYHSEEALNARILSIGKAKNHIERQRFSKKRSPALKRQSYSHKTKTK